MNNINESIAQTPIVLDNGDAVQAHIFKQSSGLYAVSIDYPHKANVNPTRTKQIVDALWRDQYRDWFRFIRFQRSTTPQPMPALNPTKQL